MTMKGAGVPRSGLLEQADSADVKGLAADQQIKQDTERNNF